MKRRILCLAAVGLIGASLLGCSTSSATTIKICASELPHAKILNDCIKSIVAEDGYELDVTVLDWTMQNQAVSDGDYDANYFQHIPYLSTYTGTPALIAACKCHYERLCLYTENTAVTSVFNGAKIEIINDVSNVERALTLLASYNILTIKDSDYDTSGNFTNFSSDNPDSAVTWTTNYANCTLTCVAENQLCASLPDYDFGIIPGNTAMTGLGDTYTSRIVLSEKADDATISEKANVIAVRETDKDSAKTKELVKAFADARVATFIADTFGDSVVYHYENLID